MVTMPVYEAEVGVLAISADDRVSFDTLRLFLFFLFQQKALLVRRHYIVLQACGEEFMI